MTAEPWYPIPPDEPYGTLDETAEQSPCDADTREGTDGPAVSSNVSGPRTRPIIYDEVAPHAARFWGNVDFGGDSSDSCWLWRGNLHRTGYGRFSASGRYFKAHRVAYVLLLGDLHEDRVCDHLCRRRECVNPFHIELVTNRENILRGVGITATCARNERCPNGHPFTDENTGRPPSGGRYCKTCQRERNASPSYREAKRLRDSRRCRSAAGWRSEA